MSGEIEVRLVRCGQFDAVGESSEVLGPGYAGSFPLAARFGEDEGCSLGERTCFDELDSGSHAHLSSSLAHLNDLASIVDDGGSAGGFGERIAEEPRPMDIRNIVHICLLL